MTTSTLSLAEARRIALAAQGFGRRRSNARPNWRTVQGAIERMGLLQIDSVNALVRSHYLPAFSRVGAYDTAQLDSRAFEPRRRQLYEYWGHEASLLPLARHPLFRWRMERAERLEGMYKQIAEFVRDRRVYIDEVLAEIGDRGALSARELTNRSGSAGSWQWHDGKIALEYLFWSGRVSVVTRRRFERVYDVTERALPAGVLDLPTPDEDEAQRQLVKIAAVALGIATEADLRDYFRLGVSAAKRCVAELVESGEILAVRVEDWPQVAYLDPGARLPRRVRGAALLSPFDPLVWERSRTERLFDFRYRLEIYTPVAKRRYGYYVLPFLLDERLVGRVDLKAERSTSTLRVIAAFGEAAIVPGAVAEALTGELSSLASWLGLERIVFGRRGDLMATLRGATPRY